VPLLDLTGPTIPGNFVTPARMLNGPWKFKWTSGWPSALGSGKEWTAFFVFFQDPDTLTESMDLRFIAGTVTVEVTEVGSNRLSTPITFLANQEITFVVDPIARTLDISGATTGNGVFASGGGPWWPLATAEVRVGAYYTEDAYIGPIGGTFTDVEGFDLAMTGAGTLALAGISQINSTVPMSGSGVLALAGQTNEMQLAMTGAGTLALAGVATVNTRLPLSGAGSLTLEGTSQGTAEGPFAAFLSSLQSLLPPGKAWTRDPSTVVTKVLRGFVPELVRVQDRIDTLLRELNPGEAVELLPEYELAYGLPDACSTLGDSIEARQADVLSRLREDAGHNPADYIAIADASGYTGALVYRHPFPPFTVGESGAGERLYGAGGPSVYILAYMANRIASPNDFSTWTTGGTSSVDADAAVAPDGNTTADRLNIGSVTFSHLVNSPSAEFDLQFSVWLRSESGEKSIALWCRANSVIVAQFDFTVDTIWRRFETRAASGLPITHVDITASGGGTVSVLAWNACVGVPDERFECRLSHVQQAHTEAVFRVIGDHPAD
jgi:uncharacterized protein YmfQ (DUF2313 family)